MLALLKEKYEGFGPTLAAEKLFEIEVKPAHPWKIDFHREILKNRMLML